jgi:hypothetical protein
MDFVARKKLPGPHTSVKPGKPKKIGTVLFEDCLRLLGGLDHFLRLSLLKRVNCTIAMT